MPLPPGWDPEPKPPGSFPRPPPPNQNRQPSTSTEQGPIPIAYGTCKITVKAIEKQGPLPTQPSVWTASTAYEVGQFVQNRGNAYECITRGTSAGSGGPSGGAADIIDGTVHWKYRQQLPFPMWFQFFLGALCEGPAEAAVSAWYDKERVTAPTSTLLGKGMELKLGPDAGGQTVPGSFDQSGYQHTVLMSPLALGNVTGTKQELPDMAVELRLLRFGATTADVNPGDIVNDLLTHARRGCNWPSSRVDVSITGTAASGFRVYCDAAGLRFSMVLDSQQSATRWIESILAATNSEAIWSGGKLKIAPLGDQAIPTPVYGSTGYVPANTSQYNLTTSDFLDRERPVRATIKSYTDRFNTFPIEFTDRSQAYARTTVEDPDQLDVDARGGKAIASTLSLPVTFADGTRVTMLSRILAQRSLNVRNTYSFRLPWAKVLLEPCDIVTLPAAVVGKAKNVRILSWTETADRQIEVTAEDYPAAVQAAKAYTPQVGDGYRPNETGTVANLPTQTPNDQLSDKNFANLWPNATSEALPPAGFTPPEDGSNAEYDFRYEAGAPPGSYAGTWVRRFLLTAVGTKVVKCRRPVIAGDVYRISAFGKWIQTGGNPNVGISIRWRDAALNQIGFPGSTAQATSVTSWTAMPSFSEQAPTNAAFADFEIFLSTAAAGTAEWLCDGIFAGRVLVTDDLAVGAVKATTLAAEAKGADIYAEMEWNSTTDGLSSSFSYSSGSVQLLSGTGLYNATYATTRMAVSAANGTITVSDAGDYEIEIKGFFRSVPSSGAPAVSFGFYKNGSTQLKWSRFQAGSGAGVSLPVVMKTKATLAANDTIDVRIADAVLAGTTVDFYSFTFTLKRVS